MRNTLRTPLRSIAIIIMIAISVGLILSMLAARGSISSKITQVEGSTANQITINPAGIQGGFGGGNPLTAAQVASVQKTAHISSLDETLSDKLTASTSSLTPSQQLGSFGARMQQDGAGASTMPSSSFGGNVNRPTPQPRITVTGTNNPSSTITTKQITSGTAFSGSSAAQVAMVGTTLAAKNNLKVGSTFTAYNSTFTVVAIYDTGNTFTNNGMSMPLTTLQSATTQPGAVTNISAIVDSSNNVPSVVSALKSSLGSAADITSEASEAATLVQPLKSIASLALAGVIAAAVAGAAIVLLAMTIIVRERRREVGVMKAIGAKNSVIVRQFSTEALSLTIVGGIIGIGLGLAAAGPITSSLAFSAANTPNSTTADQPVTGVGRHGFGGGGGQGGFGSFRRSASKQFTANISSITTDVSPSTFGLSVVILLLIAVIGSVVPAWLITKVKPAEILRNE